MSDETLDRLETAADSMAMAYATTPPVILLPRVRTHLDYVTSRGLGRGLTHDPLLAVHGTPRAGAT